MTNYTKTTVGKETRVELHDIVRHLLHSTAKAHSAAHKIIAVIEIHAQRQIFFFAACVILESR